MKIKFLPQNIEVEGTPNKSLLQIATENKLEIRSICKGVPSCAECRVRISEGERNVLPPTKAELSLIGTSHFIDGRRLSCQVRCFGDVTVDLSEQVERAEHKTKKIRGFRSQKQIESHAVNDTFLLTEKDEPAPRRDQQGQQREPQEGQQQAQPSQQGQQGQQGPQQPQQKKQQHPPREQRPQQQQRQPQQGQGQGQQQGQGRQQNQQRNNNQQQRGQNNQQQPRRDNPQAQQNQQQRKKD